MTTMTEMFGEPIYTYTAEQAEEDGALVRVPAELSKAPIYLTRNLYETWIAVPAGLEGWQDVTGRMADLVNMARLAFSGGDREDLMRTNIVCRFQMTPRVARSVTVWGVIDGAGLTLMLPEDY